MCNAALVQEFSTLVEENDGLQRKIEVSVAQLLYCNVLVNM